MESFLRFIEKYLIPKRLYQSIQPIYHFSLSYLSAFFYGFPSEKMTIIGVTGTKGKTTTCNLIAHMFNYAGFKTGMATTVNFRIGNKEWKNETKQTMLGRFQLQKLLYQMQKEECKYAVVETSSEGILQYRHKFIDYDAAVFTNLSPEHIERHGNFENYRAAKIKLFEKVAHKKTGIGIYNLDDENVEFFLEPKLWQKYGYTTKSKVNGEKLKINNILKISKIKLSANKTEFTANKEKFELPFIGKFNVYNAAAAICAAWSQNISKEKIRKALKEAKAPNGRMEIIYAKALTNRHIRIDKKNDFTIIIDYAHEPASLEAVYKTINEAQIAKRKSKLICLLGAQGGGRDKWKRPRMGKIAEKYCEKIILTNEDPYDENPLDIINNIESGFSRIQNLYKIIDRLEAIKKAIYLAKKGDVVILTGKGGESWMCVENNQKIPWDEGKIIEEILNQRITN